MAAESPRAAGQHLGCAAPLRGCRSAFLCWSAAFSQKGENLGNLELNDHVVSGRISGDGSYSSGQSTRIFATIGAALHCAESSFLEWRARFLARKS